MGVILTADEFMSPSYMGTHNSATPEALNVAINTAEGSISEVLGYPMVDGDPTLLSRSWTEDYRWPPGGRPIKLLRPRVASVDTVLTLHDIGDCDCVWTELTGCAFLDPTSNEVRFRSCDWAASCWVQCSCPHTVRVTYTAGFTTAEVAATTSLGQRLRMAVSLLAKEHLELLDFHSEGVAPVKSFGSMGYSESRDVTRTEVGKRLGKGWLAEQAANLIQPLLNKTKVVVLRGH